jgi:isoquinoline 1-oxidoreductase subunit alpha
MKLMVNGTLHTITVEPAMPLLWVLRDKLNLTGTKYGCGAALCGACTVWLDDTATRACVIPVSACADRAITTIEGLEETRFKVLQDAWVRHQVPQCGYCQSGALMAAAGLLAANLEPSDDDIGAALGNLCRCGTYQRMRDAISEAAKSLREKL